MNTINGFPYRLVDVPARPGLTNPVRFGGPLVDLKVGPCLSCGRTSSPLVRVRCRGEDAGTTCFRCARILTTARSRRDLLEST